MPELDICRQKIMSNDYFDFIVSQFGNNNIEELLEDGCEQSADFIYKILYVEAQRARPLTFGRYSYNSIPKCYTLIDTEAMTQAGIL